MTTKQRKTAVQFFVDNAGYGYNPATETKEEGQLRGAKALAKAEAWASENGYAFQWDRDEIDSREFSDDPDPWQLWACVMRDGDGAWCQSLGGVDFGRDKEPWTESYRRVVEAELALEEMPDDE